MIVNLIEWIKSHQQLCKKYAYILTGLIVLWSIVFVHHEESHFSLESIPAFWTFFTICSCIVLVFFAMIYGKMGIKKEEEYYDK